MTDTAIETSTLNFDVGMLCTKKGLNVLSAGLTGERILISRVAIGDGVLNAESEADYRQKVLDLESMINWRMDLKIGEAKNLGNGEMLLTCGENNAHNPEPFFIREQAVFAIDQTTGKEILYSYRNSGDKSSFLPSNTGPVTKDIKFGIHVIIQNAKNVTAIIDSSFAYVSLKDYTDHVGSEHPHPNTPNHYLNVYDTNKFWATDEDNDLHQISLGNVRQVILGDAAKLIPSLGKTITDNKSKIDELDIFTKATNELGLDANLMIVEDFAPASTVDNFSVKVLSCARGGRLIGVESDNGILKGAYYWISDGVKSELVQVAGVAYSTDYYHVTITQGLTYEYNLGAVKLYRTTYRVGTVDTKKLSWTPAESFVGIAANIAREVPFNTTQRNAAAMQIEGEGMVTTDGYFTLTNDKGTYEYSGTGDSTGDDTEEFLTQEEIDAAVFNNNTGG